MAVHHHLHALDFNVDCSCHELEPAPKSDAPADEVPRGVQFGEFLVEQRAIDRHQLLLALQMQDSRPGTRLGECLAALGIIAPTDIDDHLGSWIRFLTCLAV
jgi:hypothetical protein